ncbi:MAG: methyltransferase [Alphaproteobacteria bacterium RIFOXYD12_FULL_60_8]|nr:MAG: methyltransferase [Alphaproteobacteria bacterium RIFOXYD12_FULL_60_8]
MGQNTSSAVMQQRKEPSDSLDFFPTPLWATRALVEHVIRPYFLTGGIVWEPACGQGHMARPLGEYFNTVFASDVFDYGFGDVRDFLWPVALPPHLSGCDWVITNPPFNLAKAFIKRGLEVADGVAVLVRTSFLEGVGRYRDIFSVTPPSIIAPFCERVPMIKGRVDIKATTATSYCWLVFRRGQNHHAKPDFVWIPPCRKQLERPGDYDPVAA